MSEGVPPTDLSPPDIAALRAGNTGVEFVTTLEAAEPGLHVLINAITHGNELCGAIAVERLLRLGVRPRRGRLTLVLANVAAFQRFDPAQPQASRCVDEDFNRVWSDASLDGDGDSVELRRARVLRPVYRQADALLDLHSMTNPGEPLALCGRTGRARALARALGVPRWVIADSGHAAGPRLIEYDAFAVSDAEAGPTGKVALLVECGQHLEPAAAEVAFTLCALFLRHFGLISSEAAEGLVAPPIPGRQTVVEVTDVITAASDGFVFTKDYAGMEIVPHAGTVIGHERDTPLRTPYDNCVLIMPSRRARRGQTVVRLGRVVES